MESRPHGGNCVATRGRDAGAYISGYIAFEAWSGSVGLACGLYAIAAGFLGPVQCFISCFNYLLYLSSLRAWFRNSNADGDGETPWGRFL